jgi:tRNA(Ile)-lysidine synthase
MPKSAHKRNQSVLAAKPDFSYNDCDALFATLRSECHIALAVSGGSDSMAMLRLAEQWSKGLVKLTVLTVDHGLRLEAAAEAAQVAAWCDVFSIEHHTLHWQGEKPKTGVQAKARAARYDLMTAWCVRNQVAWLLTAHTQDDQAETVLMRQSRTNTVESLAGIWETSEWGGAKIMRPLLSLRRAELRSFLNRVGQAWIEDPSNADERFERVRVRKTMDETRIADLAQIAVDAGRAARGLEISAKTWLEQHLTVFPEGYGTVPRTAFCALEVELQRRVLQQLIQNFGAGNRVDPGELDHISRWIAGGGLSRRTLGGAVIASRKEVLVVGREAGRISPTPVLVSDSGEVLWDRRFSVLAPPQSQIVPAVISKGFARRKDIPSFVQGSLPAVLLGNGTIAVPHLGVGHGASAKFMRCLR